MFLLRDGLLPLFLLPPLNRGIVRCEGMNLSFLRALSASLPFRFKDTFLSHVTSWEERKMIGKQGRIKIETMRAFDGLRDWVELAKLDYMCVASM